MAKREQDEQGFGTQLPGTGGDFIDSQDVEGHGIRRDEESAIRRDEESAIRRDGDLEAIRRDDDVEGHRMRSDDAETGLYNPGPTTQGEFVKRGPGDNPHGDR